MPNKNKHIHRYERVILGKNYLVFRCNLPNCTHYVPYKLAHGRACICNRCGNAMLLDRRAMKLTKPHCIDCVKPRNKEEFDAIGEFLQEKELVAKSD